MTVFLIVFSVFNLFAGAASAGAAARMASQEGREGWASTRLYVVALILAWGMAIISLGATAAAWLLAEAGGDHFALLVLAPIAWLAAMGVAFAIVDVAEDGVLDLGRGRR